MSKDNLSREELERMKAGYEDIAIDYLATISSTEVLAKMYVSTISIELLIALVDQATNDSRYK